MRARLIPCPVCGARLTRNAESWIDCPDGHRALTDPIRYDQLRLDAVLADIRECMCLSAEERPTCVGEHSWVDARGIPELNVEICVRCLTLAVSAESGPTDGS